MTKAGKISRNKVTGAVMALVSWPFCLLSFDPPRSYLFACAGLCFAWYEAFGLLPNISNNATIPDIYRAFRAMPAQGSGFGARVVGSLGIALVIAGILVR
ncbi:hypothetical protein [Dyella japonica]|uniref:Uncharacterized protein n=1 Tax=Dyella japonica TaxID=231455 RepID=A0ABV2JXF6_9GAMM